jgi:hypothetical protein
MQASHKQELMLSLRYCTITTLTAHWRLRQYKLCLGSPSMRYDLANREKCLT